MVSRDRRNPSDLASSDHSAVLQVRLPAHRLDQLMLLADRDGMLATTVVTDWVLDHLEQLDPEGELLSVPAAQGPCGGRLASVTRLPVMSGMADAEFPAGPAGMASVTSLRASVGAD
jgi:hypothetical protein